MATQNNVIRLSGKVGDVIGYKRGGKDYIKGVGRDYQLSKESIKSGNEFGRGSKAAVLIKNAFAEILQPPLYDGNLHNRLAERLRTVIRSGDEKKKGKRTVFDGNAALLKGFELNAYTKFDKLALLVPKISLTTKAIHIKLQHIVWSREIKPIADAKYAVLRIACGFFDFTANTYSSILSNELRIESGKDLNEAVIALPVKKRKEMLILPVLTIAFEDVHNSRWYNRKSQAGMIADAIHLRDGKRVEFKIKSREDRGAGGGVEGGVSVISDKWIVINLK